MTVRRTWRWQIDALLVIVATTALIRVAFAGEEPSPSVVPQTYSAGSALNRKTLDYCQDQPLGSPIALFEVIERALCESPKTRSAWAGIKAAEANLASSQAAYLPSLGAEIQYNYQHNVTQASDDPQLESNYTKAVNQETLSLGWVLYDFGARTSAVKNSKELLLAAQANQDATLQSVFALTAKDYFTAQAANAIVQAKRRIESAARDSQTAASARVAKGVSPITDELQANTALAQAEYERAKAEGSCRTAIGALAIDMSLSPDEALHLPELNLGALPDDHFVAAIHEVLEDAKNSHPKVLAAAAQWQASLANVTFVRTQGLPKLKLIGESTRSNQPVSASLGQPELPAQTRENYIGVKIEIPLFEGFSRGDQIHQAEAQAQIQEEGLRDAQQQVAIGIWSSVQALDTDTENLRNTDAVLQSAQQAFESAQHRYQSGVGNILELLSAQSILASAEEQRIQAQLEWRIARLQMAASLGKLGMWALR